MKKINNYLYLVRLFGSYYEMGIQYGLKTKLIMKKEINVMLNFIINNKKIFMNKIPKKYRSNCMIKSLSLYQKDIHKYLEKDIVDFIKGMGKSLDIDYRIILLINLFTDLTNNHCILLSKTINNKKFNLRTLDLGLPLLTHYIIVYKPKRQNAYMNLTAGPFVGCCSGYSSKDIFFGETYYDTNIGNNTIIGTPFHHLSHNILSNANNLEDGKTILQNINRKSNLQLLIADKNSSNIFLSCKDKLEIQESFNGVEYSVTPNEKKNFDKNFKYLDSIENIIKNFIPNTRSGEQHILMTYGDHVYISVTTAIFQSYNNDFYKISKKQLFS